MNKIFEQLLAIDNSPEMQQAISTGIFYVEAISTMCGYSIGAMDADLPAVYATKELAEKDNQEMIENHLQQIEDGERDKSDEWEGEVMKCRWDGSENMSLYCEGHFIATDSWKSLAGL